MAKQEYKCDYCGYKTVNLYGSYLCPTCRHVLKPTHPQKVAKPLNRRWWFWTLIIIVVIGTGWHYKDRISKAIQEVSSTLGSQGTSQSSNNSSSGILKPTPFDKKDCEEIDYKTLARNPEKYNNTAIKMKVVVKQTFESGGIKYYACYDYVDDNMFTNVDYDKPYVVYDYRDISTERILVDDVIEVYGTFWGTQKVTRTITNVEIDALKIKMRDSVLIDEGD